jgi:hypothetical protein
VEFNGTAFRYSSAQASRTAVENSATVMQQDILASAQYAHARRAKTLEPEKSLILAILEDAVRCFQENHRARCGNAKRTFDEAQRWLFQSRCDWVFSFENVCAVLGFDPQYIRRGLSSWKERDVAKQCGAPLWKPAALRSGTHD